MLNKDELKEQLTIDQIFDFVADFGGEPRMVKENEFFVSRTICHNPAGQGSYKLYYYENTHLFKCYTDCDDSFDIYELICKIKNNNREYKTYITREGLQALREWQIFDAVAFIAFYFGYSSDEFQVTENKDQLPDWSIFSRYEKINNLSDRTQQRVELEIFDDKILRFLPRPIIADWVKEEISQEVMNARGICYDPVYGGIIIPHYDIENNLVGIRSRTMSKEEEVLWGKYKPAILNFKMYNHPLSFNLYNLNNSKENIKLCKKVVIFEGEKSCLKYASLFGMENDISVAVCGSSLIAYQVKLLMSLGVEEIVIAFDKQFAELGDKDWEKWTKKLRNIYDKYGNYVQVSFMFDIKDLLGFKDSPIDKGKEVFLQLFEERIYL